MNHTFGYILCCQSPALFLLAIALVIRFFICKGRAKFRAVLSLIGGLVCIALGVVLYYQGLVREHFAVRDFWHIRIPGWIGLALMAALLIYLSLRAFLRFSARRSEQKEAIRAENARRQEMEKAKADAYEAGRAEAMSTLVSATAGEMHAAAEPAAPIETASPDAAQTDAPPAEAISPSQQPPAS